MSRTHVRKDKKLSRTHVCKEDISKVRLTDCRHSDESQLVLVYVFFSDFESSLFNNFFLIISITPKRKLEITPSFHFFGICRFQLRERVISDAPQMPHENRIMSL